MLTNTPPMGTLIGDALPGSPSLTARGSIPTGTCTMQFTRMNVPSFADGFKLPLPFRDRIIEYQTWYPVSPDDSNPPAVYTDYMGRIDLGNLVPFQFAGRAHENGKPDSTGGPRPVVILSHGYPGSRMLLSNLAENLSSKGFIVLSIAHRDNTYPDFLPNGSLESALVHRSMDQRAMLDELPALNADGPLAGLLDLERVAMIGFSMGGYGLLRTIGAKVHPNTLSQYPELNSLLDEPEWQGDTRIKAAVLFAPATFLIDADRLSDIKVPTLWVCGTMDRTVHYEAVQSVFRNTIHSRRTLISYIGCGHNVANNPAPVEALSSDWSILKRWADPVWDTSRLNNYNQHFVTAFLMQHLLGENGESYYARLEPGKSLPGFVLNTDVGISIEHLPAKI
ncbi:MAG: hypothetical protein IJ242_06935 [Clostridia bacterium]|nr:hypothetical protein [Clostridia bacterium]